MKVKVAKKKVKGKENKNKDGLKDEYRKTILDILTANPRVERIVLFGSRAMGTFTPESDIDLVLYGEELTLTDLAKLKEKLEDTTIPQKVDLLLAKDIEKEELLEHIRKHGVEWWRRKNGKWKTSPFTEAVEVNPKVRLERGQVYPFVDMKAIDPKRRNVSETEYRVFKSGGAKFMPNDTLMARITPCLENGKIARYVPKINRNGPAFGSTEFIVIRGRKGITDNNFVYYMTKWQEFRQFAIAQMTGSSGRQRVPIDSLSGFSVPIPELSEQRAIAHILGTLDDKIELNRQMNETLEKMAQAIFKSWFVDFDPVVWKAVKAGNPVPEKFAEKAAYYKKGATCPVPNEIAVLFPDSFEESELGPIPRGWRVGTLENIAFLKTKTIQPKNFPDKKWEHYSIPAFDAGKQPVWETGKLIKSGKYLVSENCVLASKLNPQFPRVWLPDVQNPDSAICSTEFMPFVPREKLWRFFLYEMFQSHHIQSEILGRATGSTGSRQRVKPKEVASMPCLIPSKDVIDVFCEQVRALHENQLSNIRESYFLASLRDTLLPKLISGELRVPDAEKFIDEVRK